MTDSQVSVAPIAEVNIATSEFKANPFPFYAQLRSEAPVYRTKLPDRRDVWLVTRYDDVLAVLKDERFGKDKINARTPPWLPGMFKPLMRNMLDVDVPDHTRLRGLVQKVFTVRLIENLRDRIQGLADELLNQVQTQRRRMDLIRDYAIPIPTTIIAELLGVPVKDRHKFHRWSSRAISSKTRQGDSLFLKVDVGGETVRVFGRPGELAERLEASGYDIPASEIEAGMELHLPCLVKVGQGNNGYKNIEEFLPEAAG